MIEKTSIARREGKGFFSLKTAFHIFRKEISLPFKKYVEISGRVAEWPNASVLKTEVLQGTGGSNPSSSVLHSLS